MKTDLGPFCVSSLLPVTTNTAGGDCLFKDTPRVETLNSSVAFFVFMLRDVDGQLLTPPLGLSPESPDPPDG